MGASGWDEEDARTGFLVVRLWLDGDQPPHLRARLHGVIDVPDGEFLSEVVTGRDRLLAAIDVWLSEFEGEGRAKNTHR
jgi:hypothetical protein